MHLHSKRVFFYRADRLHHYTIPEQTNLQRAPSAFHVFTSGNVRETPEGQQRRRIEERKKERDSVFAGLGFFELEKPSLKKNKNMKDNTFLFIMEKANKCACTCLERKGRLAFSNSCDKIG